MTQQQSFEEALAAIGPYKVYLHRIRTNPEKWQVCALGICMAHQGTATEALTRLASAIEYLKQ